MDPSLFKDFKTSRGLTYHYFYSPSSDASKPTLLFLHGFPSTSSDWARAATFFSQEGYGVLVPDMLGYGGTDKPADPDAYRMKKMVQDFVDILDSEKLVNVVAISHDWGSGLNSRLANYFPNRISAHAFLALGYLPPVSEFDVDVVNAKSVEKHGYAKYGYWKFFAKEGADKITGDHLESFFSLLYATEKGLGKKHFCPDGALEEWLLADRKSEGVIITDEEKQYYINTFAKDGFAGPFCWYKAMVHKLTPSDDKEIPKTAYPITRPVFVGACSRDPTCVAAENIAIARATCPVLTVKEFDSGHWVLHERPTEVIEALKEWLNGLTQARL